MNAVTMFESLLKKFSFLREVDVKQWDFTLMVAGVFIAVTRLVDLGLRGTTKTNEEGRRETYTVGPDQW